MSIVDTTFTGFAALAEGQQGICRAAYSFSGGSGVSFHPGNKTLDKRKRELLET